MLTFRWRTELLQSPPCPNLLWHGNVWRDRTRHEDQVWRTTQSYWWHNGTSHWILDHQWNGAFSFSDQIFCIFEDQQRWDCVRGSEKVWKSFDMKIWRRFVNVIRTLILAQRTQGIESLNFIDFFVQINESRSTWLTWLSARDTNNNFDKSMLHLWQLMCEIAIGMVLQINSRQNLSFQKLKILTASKFGLHQLVWFGHILYSRARRVDCGMVSWIFTRQDYVS